MQRVARAFCHVLRGHGDRRAMLEARDDAAFEALGASAQRELVRACIANGDEAHFDEVLATITHSGALDYTRQCAEAARDRAKTSISAFPDSPGKDALSALADFAFERDR
jgi:geranylgeranyl pyrophosphate synthase